MIYFISGMLNLQQIFMCIQKYHGKKQTFKFNCVSELENYDLVAFVDCLWLYGTDAFF